MTPLLPRRGGAARASPLRPSTSPVARLLLVVLSGYRSWVSPLLGPHCRFAPSCSEYAIRAVSRFGAVRGGALAVRRLLRCHPFHPGGHDPVPPTRSSPASSGAPTC